MYNDIDHIFSGTAAKMAENIKVLGCAIITLFILLPYFHGNWMSYIQKRWTPSRPSIWLNVGIHLLRHIISVVHKEVECLLAMVHDVQTIVFIYKTKMIKQRGQLWKSRKKKSDSLSLSVPFVFYFLLLITFFLTSAAFFLFFFDVLLFHLSVFNFLDEVISLLGNGSGMSFVRIIIYN